MHNLIQSYLSPHDLTSFSISEAHDLSAPIICPEASCPTLTSPSSKGQLPQKCQTLSFKTDFGLNILDLPAYLVNAIPLPGIPFFMFLFKLRPFSTLLLNNDMQSLPFGGVKDSGFGRFAGIEGLRACCLVKSVVEDRWWPLIKTKIPKPIQVSSTSSKIILSFVHFMSFTPSFCSILLLRMDSSFKSLLWRLFMV